MKRDPQNEPLESLDEWDEDVLMRYGHSSESNEKTASEFRDYRSNVAPRVREFYRIHHQNQTLDFARQKHAEFLSLDRSEMTVWEAMEFLNTLVDESDPDTELTQIQHLMQTSEAIRAAGHPRWFILTGLIHDLGKILCLFGEPQWAVVGDTYPVGCAFSESIVFHEFFDQNPDATHPTYSTEYGIYEPHVGLDNVTFSWGHDEYLYHVVRDHLPMPALYMIRYHSFYPGHRDHAYNHLMNEQDTEMFHWVREFNPFDLYSKSDSPPDVDALRPYYEDLIAEFLPGKLRW